MLIKYISNSTQSSFRCRGSRETLHRHPLTRIAPTFTFKDYLQSTSYLDTSEEPAWLLLLLGALGKITSAQAKRLDDLGLTYDELRFLRKSSDSTDDFVTMLSSKGVNSKALREKLASFVKS